MGEVKSTRGGSTGDKRGIQSLALPVPSLQEELQFLGDISGAASAGRQVE